MGATTTFEDIGNKITTYFSANFSAISVQYPNTDALDVKSLEYYATFDIITFPSRRLCITGNDDTGLIHLGQVVINVYRRLGKGVGGLNQHIDDICDLFRYHAITWNSSKIQFFVPQITDIGPAGLWYQKNVSIPWEYLT